MISPGKPISLIGKKKIDILHAPSINIAVDKDILDLASRMLATCRVNRGHAIAAVQVGVPINLIVLNNGEAFVNLKQIKHNETIVVEPEGCLSLPGSFYEVPRYSKVGFKFQDLNHLKYENEFEDFMARVWQHEYDHILGKLISEQNYKKVGMKSER